MGAFFKHLLRRYGNSPNLAMFLMGGPGRRGERISVLRHTIFTTSLIAPFDVLPNWELGVK